MINHSRHSAFMIWLANEPYRLKDWSWWSNFASLIWQHTSPFHANLLMITQQVANLTTWMVQCKLDLNYAKFAKSFKFSWPLSFFVAELLIFSLCFHSFIFRETSWQLIHSFFHSFFEHIFRKISSQVISQVYSQVLEEKFLPVLFTCFFICFFHRS